MFYKNSHLGNKSTTTLAAKDFKCIKFYHGGYSGRDRERGKRYWAGEQKRF